MKIIWTAEWYELDQTIIVGDEDYFYLHKRKNKFSNDFGSKHDREVHMKITDISHKELGSVKGIDTEGLVYKIYLMDGRVLEVDAEESIGEIFYPEGIEVKNWTFTVEVEGMKETGESSFSRLKSMSKKDVKKVNEERTKRYKQLLKGD